MKISLHKNSLRLASLYLVILMSISIFFSAMIYQLSVQELGRGLRGPRVAIEGQMFPGISNEIRKAIDDEREEIYREAKARVFQRLVFINIIILMAGGGLSYYFAVRTLRPIEDAHEAQNRFTADASHELRTPITAMLTENEVTLMNPKLSLSEAKQQIESTIEELQKLSVLSDSLMRLAGLENAELHKEELQLQQIIATAIDRVQPLADTKKITITTHLPKSPVRIIGDEKNIEEVLVILVDNAIKYSNESSKVSVSCEVRQKQAVLSVKDNGIGISKEDISHIFDRFYRADTSRTNQHTSGHGLGLAIAKDIVEKHKGTIVASSIQSKGSTFTITLPIA